MSSLFLTHRHVFAVKSYLGKFCFGICYRGMLGSLLAIILACHAITIAQGATSLDSTMFPTFKMAGKEAVVVAGNWEEADASEQADGKAWIPARLFGATSATAKFKLEFSVKEQAHKVSIRKDRASNPNSLTDKGSDNPVEVEPKNGQWNCEVFLLVKQEIPKDPVVVTVEGATGGGGEGFSMRLVLGEVWLLAGSGNIGVQTEVSANQQVVAAHSGGAGQLGISVVFPKEVTGLGSGAKSATAPAMGVALGEALTMRFKSAVDSVGVRPVCIYSWAQGRYMIEAWKKPKEGAPWQGLGWQGSPKVFPTLPGVRGVMWWHGEWEAEHSPVGTADQYGFDLKKFRIDYAGHFQSLRENVAARLAMVESENATDDDLKKRMMWVTIQAPGAGRRTEFFNVLNPINPDDLRAKDASPQSTWAALRAAQFAASDELRKSTWNERPLALAVPLDVPAGWQWGTRENRPQDFVRFERAAQRISQEIIVAMLQTTQSLATMEKFGDGWPRVVANELRLPGVSKIDPPDALSSGPGSRPPLLEMLITDQGKEKWKTLKLTDGKVDAGDWVVPLDAGWKELRYGWNDANTGLHRRTININGTPEVTLLPPFLFTNP
jgi:hypothetical protein